MKQTKCHTVDLNGLIAPFTLLKVSQVFRALEIGDRLEICWSDSGSCQDLFKILPRSSYKILSKADSGNQCTLKLIKTSSSGEPLVRQDLEDVR